MPVWMLAVVAQVRKHGRRSSAGAIAAEEAEAVPTEQDEFSSNALSCARCVKECAAQVRKQITRQKKQPLEKLVAAEEVDAVPEEQEEVIRNMYEMMGALDSRDGKAANVLECIINHRSFSQTIENLFALSFLVCLLP